MYLKRNNKNIFERLQKLGFPGSYRTVCVYVKAWKDKVLDESDEIKEEAERLTHPPAEAQVDFGVTEVVQEGKVKDVHCLIMSFPYSNGGLLAPLPAENQERFLEGIKMLFVQAGYVPRKLRLDNLSATIMDLSHKPVMREKEMRKGMLKIRWAMFDIISSHHHLS